MESDEGKVEGIEPIDSEKTSGDSDLEVVAKKVRDKIDGITGKYEKVQEDLEVAKKKHAAEYDLFVGKIQEQADEIKKEAQKVNYLVESIERFMSEVSLFLVAPGVQWRDKISGVKTRIKRLGETIDVIKNGNFISREKKEEGPTVAEKLADALAGKPKEKAKPKVKKGK